MYARSLSTSTHRENQFNFLNIYFIIIIGNSCGSDLSFIYLDFVLFNLVTVATYFNSHLCGRNNSRRRLSNRGWCACHTEQNRVNPEYVRVSVTKGTNRKCNTKLFRSNESVDTLVHSHTLFEYYYFSFASASLKCDCLLLLSIHSYVPARE